MLFTELGLSVWEKTVPSASVRVQDLGHNSFFPYGPPAR